MKKPIKKYIILTSITLLLVVGASQIQGVNLKSLSVEECSAEQDAVDTKKAEIQGYQTSIDELELSNSGIADDSAARANNLTDLENEYEAMRQSFNATYGGGKELTNEEFEQAQKAKKALDDKLESNNKVREENKRLDEEGQNQMNTNAGSIDIYKDAIKDLEAELTPLENALAECLDKCPEGKTKNSEGICVDNSCTNGATNYPECDNNQCTNGATNYPECDNNQCTNGATNYPECDNNQCTNGATNYPECNDNTCTNGATNYPECDNYPKCGDGTVDSGEECDDGGTTDGDGCDESCIKECPDDSTLGSNFFNGGGNLKSDTLNGTGCPTKCPNGLDKKTYPDCKCPAGQEVKNGACVPKKKGFFRKLFDGLRIDYIEIPNDPNDPSAGKSSGWGFSGHFPF